MPRKDSILNLPGFAIRKIESFSPVIIHVEYRRKVRCMYCNNKQLGKKSRYIRTVNHELIGIRRSVLKIHAHKYYCKACNRYFNQRFSGILPCQRSTEKLKRQVYELHSKGVSQKDLACDFKQGASTIERHFHRYYERYHQELIDRRCPRVLGIDEHFFSRKQGYATTLCDLQKHKIFDVVPGRSRSSLHGYLSGLKDRHKVRVVCMDLSVTYRSIIKRYFPNAKIVADRFHVIRLMQHMFGKVYQALDPDSRYKRGALRLLAAREEKLSPKQRQRRAAYFASHPAIGEVFGFKEKLYHLLMKKQCTAKRCKRLIPVLLGYIQQLRVSGFESLQTLGKTLQDWLEPIVCMWRFVKNNGITEGFHRKMKLIQRRAYGFKNFENYRLRVKVLCS